MSDKEKSGEVELNKPTAVKMAEAEADIKAGNITPASPLSLDTAQKLQQLAGFWGLVSTPNGLTTVLALIAGLGSAVALVAKSFSGAPSTDKDGYVLVKVVEMPKDIHLKMEEAPTPLPPAVTNNTKPFTVITFSDVAPPPGPWDSLRRQGYKVEHYITFSHEATLYAALITKCGGAPCVMVTDSKNFLGGGPIADAANIVTKYATTGGSK